MGLPAARVSLATDTEWFAAGGEHPQLAVADEQIGKELGGFCDHVLAPVHDQQAAHPAGHLTHDVAHRPSQLRCDTQRLCQRVADQFLAGDRPLDPDIAHFLSLPSSMMALTCAMCRSPPATQHSVNVRSAEGGDVRGGGLEYT